MEAVKRARLETDRSSFKSVICYVESLAKSPSTFSTDDPERTALLTLRDELTVKKPSTPPPPPLSKRKLLNRPCSPSLFAVYEGLDPSFPLPPRMTTRTCKDPQKSLNKLLSVCTTDTYSSAPVDINGHSLMLGTSHGNAPNLVGITHHSTLGVLSSPLYSPTIEELWSGREVKLFESAICMFGKNFHAIRKGIKTKTTEEVIAFYYVWKKSDHYRIWKDSYH